MKFDSSQSAAKPDALRRKLFRGLSGGAGVLLAVQARTALGAGTCTSVSATMSGNTSPRPGSGTTCSGGLSPGYWKVPQHFSSWAPAGARYPTFKQNVTVCSTGMKYLTLSNLLTPGTTLESVGFYGGAPSGTGIWAILAFPGSFSGGQLLRALAAAWLNAGYFNTPGQQYPMTRAQIIDMWNATKSGGMYCPNGITCTTGWSASQVVSYIEGMYDLNASGGDPSLCTN